MIFRVPYEQAKVLLEAGSSELAAAASSPLSSWRGPSPTTARTSRRRCSMGSTTHARSRPTRRLA